MSYKIVEKRKNLMTVPAFEVARDRVFFVDQSDMFIKLSFCVESFITIITARHFWEDL